MHRHLARGLLFAAVPVTLITGGCGGSAHRTVVTSSTATPSTATSTAQPAASTSTQQTNLPPAPSCTRVERRADIPSTLCRDMDGLYIRMATDNHMLALANASLQLVGARTASSLSAHGRSFSLTRGATFLIITLRVTNAGKTPQVLERQGAGQFAFEPIGGATLFAESLRAENGPDRRSFVAQDTTPIRPTKARTGDVVFELPARDLSIARRNGGVLVFTDFGQQLGDTTANGPRNPTGELIVHHARLAR